MSAERRFNVFKNSLPPPYWYWISFIDGGCRLLMTLRCIENLTEGLFFVRNPDSVYPPESSSSRKRDRITELPEDTWV
jgi:hypothetical protein